MDVHPPKDGLVEGFPDDLAIEIQNQALDNLQKNSFQLSSG